MPLFTENINACTYAVEKRQQFIYIFYLELFGFQRRQKKTYFLLCFSSRPRFIKKKFNTAWWILHCSFTLKQKEKIYHTASEIFQYWKYSENLRILFLFRVRLIVIHSFNKPYVIIRINIFRMTRENVCAQVIQFFRIFFWC